MPSEPYPHPSLGGAYLRVSRASEHLAYLKQAIDAHNASWESSNQSITLEIDFDAGEVRPKLGDSPPPFPLVPAMCGVVVGELVYNLRAALDYLAFELSILHSKRIPKKGKTQFPIERSKKGWKRWLSTHLEGVSVKHRARIKGLQPCFGCDWFTPLRDISNADKHREWTIVSVEVSGKIIAERGPVGAFVDRIRGQVKRTKAPNGSELDMHVDYVFRRAITLVNGTPVIETLEELIARVRETLDFFKPDFPTTHRPPPAE